MKLRKYMIAEILDNGEIKPINRFLISGEFPDGNGKGNSQEGTKSDSSVSGEIELLKQALEEAVQSLVKATNHGNGAGSVDKSVTGHKSPFEKYWADRAAKKEGSFVPPSTASSQTATGEGSFQQMLDKATQSASSPLMTAKQLSLLKDLIVEKKGVSPNDGDAIQQELEELFGTRELHLVSRKDASAAIDLLKDLPDCHPKAA